MEKNEIVKKIGNLVFYGNLDEETESVLLSAIDLINRQKAEIERLQKEVNLVSILFQDLQEQTDEVKTKAYKEFVEKFEDKLLTYDFMSDGEYNGYYCSDVNKCIDETLKELED